MKDSKILKKARELLETGAATYVCQAIQLACEFLDVPERERELKPWINSMLQGHLTLGRWLAVKHGIKPDDPFSGPIRDLRLRWLDWMIQYCELEEAGWTPWLGRETPPETCSEVLFRYGGTGLLRAVYRWNHRNSEGDIIAYKP